MYIYRYIYIHIAFSGTWVSPLVKCQIPGFGSGHDLIVCEFEIRIPLCVDNMEPAWDSLSLLLLPHPCSCSLSCSISKNKLKKIT